MNDEKLREEYKFLVSSPGPPGMIILQEIVFVFGDEWIIKCQAPFQYVRQTFKLNLNSINIESEHNETKVMLYKSINGRGYIGF